MGSYTRVADANKHLTPYEAITEEGLPTLGGYLALGASPQQESPHLANDVVVHPGTEKARDPSIRFLGAEPAAPTITVGCGPGLMASPPGTWNQDRSRPRATVAP